MKLGISQLAFNSQTEFFDTISYLKQNKILNIEVVIPKILDWDSSNIDVLQKYIKDLQNVGLICSSTQSITFNKPLTSFNSKEFFDHLKRVSELCKIMEINTLVLGAPKLRTVFDQEYLSYNFKILDSILRDNNQILCIEPNCNIYGGSFFITLHEIVNFIKINNFTHIKTMIDTHNIIQENQNLTQEYIKYKEYIHHVHISEIGLDLFKPSHTHLEFSQCLKQHNYDKNITYEVINKYDTSLLLNSITQFKNIYNNIN
jgi:sugar phosphate isomerase/epimerase